jgi:hypothetical protein
MSSISYHLMQPPVFESVSRSSSLAHDMITSAVTGNEMRIVVMLRQNSESLGKFDVPTTTSTDDLGSLHEHYIPTTMRYRVSQAINIPYWGNRLDGGTKTVVEGATLSQNSTCTSSSQCSYRNRIWKRDRNEVDGYRKQEDLPPPKICCSRHQSTGSVTGD